MHSVPERLGPVTLARSVLDRRAELRSDPDLVPSLLRRSSTRVLDVSGGRAPVLGDDEPALAVRAPSPRDRDRLVAYLGEAGGAAYLAVLDASESSMEGPLRGLREVGTRLDPLDADVLVTAVALSNWHGAHGHCPRCGTRTEPARAGWVRVCPRDGSEHFPRTDPAVIMSVVDRDDRLLLARGAGWPQGRFSVLAGFVEPGETLEAAVVREVREEVGIGVEDVTYLGDQPWPFPTSLMLGFTARATSTDITLRDGEIVEAHWLTRDELGERYRSGEWRIAGRLSISRRLMEHWYGSDLHRDR